ncbi:TPA: alpha-galactosidase [Klebsiella pneumoniae]|nr:alpha-galactosidase [Klebsiella pneumoniae]HBW7213096.1 alpha-galactosidase [Klebsiella pneumoniae]HBY5175169.1 alpha-galactosidase [Klebsiella pneumoniae]
MKKVTYINDMEISLQYSDINNSIKSEISSYQDDGIFFVNCTFQSESAVFYPEVIIDLHFPLVNMHSCWTPAHHGHPSLSRSKGIPEWWPHFDSSLSCVAPVGAFYSQNGDNGLTFGLSETKDHVKVHAGTYEERREARVRFVLFSHSDEKKNRYSVLLRIDRRDIHFSESIKELSHWYDTAITSSPMPVPLDAYEPVYSTWYAFHQNLFQNEIEEQCQIASKLGCKTLILDDGWQTDDNRRGYKFCGDWDVSCKRFPDFKKHVENIHALGMKYILWLSVPFLGKESKKWDEFQGNLLHFSDLQQAGILDPRYKKVREYLKGTYIRLVSEYNLDGLKLDFIDEFNMAKAQGNALLPDPDRDYESLSAAVDCLLREVRQELTSLNENIMIEFRQRYIGPEIRNYGNIFRVHDCPGDSVMNRASIADLRLFSGSTAIHSDMFIWSLEDSIESISLHFINTLFSVQQLSPNLKELTATQIQLIQHWIDFWKVNKNILIHGDIKAYYPEMQYPLIEGTYKNRQIITVTAPLLINLDTVNVTDTIIVNGSMQNTILVKMNGQTAVRITTYDCLGLCHTRKEIVLSEGIHELNVPKSGYVRLSFK